MTAVLLLIGLVVRIGTLGLKGMSDVDAYRDWGNQIVSKGLVEGFGGVYFPLQYQMFAVASWLSGFGGHDVFFWLKALNAIGDIGILLLLIRSVERVRRNWVIGLYWLNPWFVALSSLGYCDFQFSFFLLLFCLRLDRAADYKSSIWAGVPLAVAFLMKPQVLVVVVAVGILFALSLLRKRPAWDALATLVAPAVLFCCYSLYFFARGKPLFHMLWTYARTVAIMPSTTAHMMNIWYPVSIVAKPGSVDWALRNDTPLLGIQMRVIGVGLMVASLSWFAYMLLRRSEELRPRRMVPLVIFGTLLLPMVMTGAHENHLFFGTLGMCLILLREHSIPKWVWAAVVTMMGVQVVNMMAFYGLGRNALSAAAPLAALTAVWKSPILRVSVSLVDIAAFLVLMAFWAKRIVPTIRRAYMPSGILALVLVVLYGGAVLERDRLAASPALGDASGRQVLPSPAAHPVSSAGIALHEDALSSQRAYLSALQCGEVVILEQGSSQCYPNSD